MVTHIKIPEMWREKFRIRNFSTYCPIMLLSWKNHRRFESKTNFKGKAMMSSVMMTEGVLKVWVE